MTIDRTPRTVPTANATVKIDEDGITVTADGPLGDDADEYAWETITTEAFEAIGGVALVEANIKLAGNLATGRDGESPEEFFPWRE